MSHVGLGKRGLHLLHRSFRVFLRLWKFGGTIEFLFYRGWPADKNDLRFAKVIWMRSRILLHQKVSCVQRNLKGCFGGLIQTGSEQENPMKKCGAN